MSRPLSVSIYSILLAGVFFWGATIYQSCTTEKPSEDLSPEEKIVQVADTYSEESYFEDDNSGQTEVAPINSDPSEVTSTLQSQEKSSQSNPATRQSSTQKATGQNNSSGALSGRHAIVAGNYLVESNADAMVARLVKEGFNNAEVTVFDLSQYYTVIAGRYSSYSEASRNSENLKQLGLDNYILTKK